MSNFISDSSLFNETVTEQKTSLVDNDSANERERNTETDIFINRLNIISQKIQSQGNRQEVEQGVNATLEKGSAKMLSHTVEDANFAELSSVDSDGVESKITLLVEPFDVTMDFSRPIRYEDQLRVLEKKTMPNGSRTVCQITSIPSNVRFGGNSGSNTEYASADDSDGQISRMTPEEARNAMGDIFTKFEQAIN